MPLNFKDTDLRIIAQPYIKNRLSVNAAKVLDIANVVKFDDSDNYIATTSEYLLVGFNDSPQALEALRRYGIPRQGMQSLVENRTFLHSLPETNEYSVKGYPESNLYRAIVVTSALMAYVRRGADAQTEPEDIVEGVRKFPASRAYQMLRVMSSDDNF